ncbi:hypothetical protein GE061_014801 [Apolygus lucorum]|uniref:Serine/threonine-protein phosphatase n=1 Tax=Apolygus lucorum TaxID=248454 RepID=A0A8S9XLE7_APOLU|nr:hypothetical protein GE061_014801 [Apolygus lucorum]
MMTVNRLLNDTVMVVIHCADMDSYVLSHLPCGWNVPYVFCTGGSWRKSALSLYDSLMGPNPPQLFEMKRIHRVWRGDKKLPLQNIIFYAKVNGTTFSDLASSTEIVSMDFLKVLITKKELSPEVQIIFGTTSNEMKQQSSSNLMEVMKEDIFTAKEDVGKLNTLINALQLSEEDQMTLYELYLSTTFPFLAMDEAAMSAFMRKLSLIPFTPDHFRAADILNKGCIDFKQVIGFISAINPQGAREGVVADQRCRYVFRYYDKDRDDRLTVEEFSKIVDDVAVNQKYVNDKKELMSGFKDGFVSLLDFVKLVGTLKLRGTSSLMKASQPVKGRLDELANTSKKSLNEVVAEEKRKNMVTPSYSLARHVVDLTPEGNINSSDIRKIQTAIKDDSRRSQLDCLLPSTSSVETFETQTAGMYVLGVLKYFSDDYTTLGDSQNNWWENQFSEYQSQLIQCCQKVQKIFEEEPRLLKIESPVYIIGDIHGNYQTIMAFQKWFWSAGLECTPGSVLLLGDYVDRGVNSVEVIAYLVAQKLKNPKKIFLLRGNHEIRKVQKEFSFHTECLAKFERGGVDVWNAVNDVFDRLPLAALIDNQIFCCHGGIPKPSTCESLAAIDAISCPLPDPGDNKLAWSLLWNDPQKVGYNYNVGKKIVEGGFSKNVRRKTGHTFDSSALQYFIDKHNLSYVVRAHEVQEEGFQVDLNNKLITVFSSSYYRGNNKAGCVLVQQNKLRIFTMS